MHRGHAGHMADGPLRQLPGGITRYGSSRSRIATLIAYFECP